MPENKTIHSTDAMNAALYGRLLRELPILAAGSLHVMQEDQITVEAGYMPTSLLRAVRIDTRMLYEGADDVPYLDVRPPTGATARDEDAFFERLRAIQRLPLAESDIWQVHAGLRERPRWQRFVVPNGKNIAIDHTVRLAILLVARGGQTTYELTQPRGVNRPIQWIKHEDTVLDPLED